MSPVPEHQFYLIQRWDMRVRHSVQEVESSMGMQQMQRESAEVYRKARRRFAWFGVALAAITALNIWVGVNGI